MAHLGCRDAKTKDQPKPVVSSSIRRWPEGMSQRALKPDVINYTAAMSACEKGGQWQRVLEFLEGMPQRALTPNVISYNAATSACAKGGQWGWPAVDYLRPPSRAPPGQRIQRERPKATLENVLQKSKLPRIRLRSGTGTPAA